MLLDYQPDDDKFFSFSSPSSYATCPTGFHSVDALPPSTSNTGKASCCPSELSPLPELFSASSTGTTSPSTPLTGSSFEMSPSFENMRSNAPHTNLQVIYPFRPREYESSDYLWPQFSKENKKENIQTSYLMTQPSPFGNDFPWPHFHPQSQQHLSSLNSSPVLSRGIFGSVVNPSLAPRVDSDGVHWPLVVAQTPPRTINPATFNFHSSPPGVKCEPSTPSRHYPESSSVLGSSPMSGYSPCTLPSQPDLDDSLYFHGMVSASANKKAEKSTQDRRAAESRLSRRVYERKSKSSYGKRRQVQSKSGFECEPVILQNSFPCGYAGCVDKNTGKPKRFKRQEHKKRHEKTVHEKANHGLHKCWVPLCVRVFTRTDNLKSHLRNTHGKDSPGARNRYVATLDPKNEEHYDPEWTGPLTDDGRPIGK